jgi:hypothetical protein
MERTETLTDALPFIGQQSSLDFDMGRDIDWTNAGTGVTTLPAGTVMCIIAATGKMCPRLERPGAETAVGLLAASADMNSIAGHGLILGGVIFENLCPDYADAAWATMKGEMSANFHWLTYGDDRLV